MLKTGTRIVAVIAIAFSFPGMVASAAAQPQAGAQPRPPAQAPESRLSIGEIAARVEAQGYRDIEEIEREGEGYEVCAEDREGREVELTVNGRTGQVEKIELCDD